MFVRMLKLPPEVRTEVDRLTTGYPAIMAFGAPSEEHAAVGFGSWLGMTSRVIPKEWQHTWLTETYTLCGIDKAKVYSAGVVEVIY